MEYVSVQDAARAWSMAERRITALCRSGRIAGAKKVGGSWLIPNDTPRPLDARTKEYTSLESKSSKASAIR